MPRHFGFPCGQTRREFVWQMGGGFAGTALTALLAADGFFSKIGFAAEAPRLYRADLLGGGIAAAAITLSLFVVHPVTALQVVAACGFVASALFSRRVFVLAGVALITAMRPLALPLQLDASGGLTLTTRLSAGIPAADLYAQAYFAAPSAPGGFVSPAPLHIRVE